MLALSTYEIRDTVVRAVTGSLDIAPLLWLRRTAGRSDADHRCNDPRPDPGHRSPASDGPSKCASNPPIDDERPRTQTGAARCNFR